MSGSKKDLLLYGFNREPKVRRFLFSILLSFLYFLLIGIPLLLGYMVRIIKHRTSEDVDINQPPMFNPIRGLAKDGLVVVGYAVTMIGVPGMGIFTINWAADNFVSQGQDIAVIDALIINSSLATLLALVVAGTFLLPSMIIRFVDTESWKEGFNLSALSSIIYSLGYIKLYVEFMIISMVAGYITGFMLQSIILAPLGALVWYIYIVIIGVLISNFARSSEEKEEKEEE